MVVATKRKTSDFAVLSFCYDAARPNVAHWSERVIILLFALTSFYFLNIKALSKSNSTSTESVE